MIWSQTPFVASKIKLDGRLGASLLSLGGWVLLDRTLPQSAKSTALAASFPPIFSIYVPSAPLCPVLCGELGGRQKGVAFIRKLTWETDTLRTAATQPAALLKAHRMCRVSTAKGHREERPGNSERSRCPRPPTLRRNSLHRLGLQRRT